MTAQTKSYQDLLEQQILLFDALSDALASGTSAIVSLQIGEVEVCIVEQKRLCVQIAASNTEIRRAYPLAALPQGNTRLSNEVRRRWCDARKRLQKFNHEQQALLQRSRRTVNAVLNGFRTFECTYANEAMKQTVRDPALQERV